MKKFMQPENIVLRYIMINFTPSLDIGIIYFSCQIFILPMYIVYC